MLLEKRHYRYISLKIELDTDKVLISLLYANMATNDIPTIIEPNSVIAPALTLNQLFEKHRRHYWERTSDVYPFSILTIGAIYKITGTKHYFGNTGIINVVKEGVGDYNRIRVLAPSGLFHDFMIIS